MEQREEQEREVQKGRAKDEIKMNRDVKIRLILRVRPVVRQRKWLREMEREELPLEESHIDKVSAGGVGAASGVCVCLCLCVYRGWGGGSAPQYFIQGHLKEGCHGDAVPTGRKGVRPLHPHGDTQQQRSHQQKEVGRGTTILLFKAVV